MQGRNFPRVNTPLLGSLTSGLQGASLASDALGCSQTLTLCNPGYRATSVGLRVDPQDRVNSMLQGEESGAIGQRADPEPLIPVPS